MLPSMSSIQVHLIHIHNPRWAGITRIQVATSWPVGVVRSIDFRPSPKTPFLGLGGKTEVRQIAPPLLSRLYVFQAVCPRWHTTKRLLPQDHLWFKVRIGVRTWTTSCIVTYHLPALNEDKFIIALIPWVSTPHIPQGPPCVLYGVEKQFGVFGLCYFWVWLLGGLPSLILVGLLDVSLLE